MKTTKALIFTVLIAAPLVAMSQPVAVEHKEGAKCEKTGEIGKTHGGAILVCQDNSWKKTDQDAPNKGKPAH